MAGPLDGWRVCDLFMRTLHAWILFLDLLEWAFTAVQIIPGLDPLQRSGYPRNSLLDGL